MDEMKTSEDWFEERGGHFYCRTDEVQLLQIYVDSSTQGVFSGPRFRCEKCGRTMSASEFRTD
jgi:hypothetical protein